MTVCVHVLTDRDAVIAVRAALGFPCPSALDTLVDAAPTANKNVDVDDYKQQTLSGLH